MSNYIALLIDQESAAESFEEMISDWLRRSGATVKEIRAAERRVLAEFERAGLVARGKRRAKTHRQAR